MGKKVLIAIYSIAILIAVVVIVFHLHLMYKNNQDKDNYYTYAIIFYPDHNTTVEGYVDNYIWVYNSVKVTINGEEYISSPENVVIVKRKDLIVNKEESNEINNN